MRDWTGNQNSIFKTLGSSSHVEAERAERDFYATEPKAVEILLQQEKFSPYIWECACGEGHISKVFEAGGYDVKNSDIVDRGLAGTEIIDFLRVKREDVRKEIARDIITNPPYKFAKEFVEKALEISMDSVKIAMFLKLTFLEGKARKKMFEKYPPKKIYVFSSRVKCAKNGDFKQIGSSAVCYAWFIWEKGFKGNPIIKWVN